jgi:hypothetical protein
MNCDPIEEFAAVLMNRDRNEATAVFMNRDRNEGWRADSRFARTASPARRRGRGARTSVAGGLQAPSITVVCQ